MAEQEQWDVFISHASEDCDAVARPLATKLRSLGLRVWYDEFALRVGDSLTKSIDYGLANSRYGIVILSRSFFSKSWPHRELAGLVARTAASDEKIILPVWHDLKATDIRSVSPPLADIVALSTDRGIDDIALQLFDVICPSARNTNGIRKVELTICITDVNFFLDERPQYWDSIERKSKVVRKDLYKSILDLGYNPESSTHQNADWTLVRYREIPPPFFRELKDRIDSIIGRYVDCVPWREQRRMGWNLIVRLGKDIGA
jgi:hypothetical protein